MINVSAIYEFVLTCSFSFVTYRLSYVKYIWMHYSSSPSFIFP